MVCSPPTPHIFLIFHADIVGMQGITSASILYSLFSKKEKGPGISPEASPKVAVTYSPASAVPSARQGLTSLFGMGRGGALALLPP